MAPRRTDGDGAVWQRGPPRRETGGRCERFRSDPRLAELTCASDAPSSSGLLAPSRRQPHQAWPAARSHASHSGIRRRACSAGTSCGFENPASQYAPHAPHAPHAPQRKYSDICASTTPSRRGSRAPPRSHRARHCSQPWSVRPAQVPRSAAPESSLPRPSPTAPLRPLERVRRHAVDHRAVIGDEDLVAASTRAWIPSTARRRGDGGDHLRAARRRTRDSRCGPASSSDRSPSILKMPTKPDVCRTYSCSPSQNRSSAMTMLIEAPSCTDPRELGRNLAGGRSRAMTPAGTSTVTTTSPSGAQPELGRSCCSFLQPLRGGSQPGRPRRHRSRCSVVTTEGSHGSRCAVTSSRGSARVTSISHEY